MKNMIKPAPVKTKDWEEVVEDLKLVQQQQRNLLYHASTVLIVGGRLNAFGRYLRYKEDLEQLSVFVGGDDQATVRDDVNALCNVLWPLVWAQKEQGNISNQISFAGVSGRNEDGRSSSLVGWIQELESFSLRLLSGAGVYFLGDHGVLENPTAWFSDLESAGYAGEDLPIVTVDDVRQMSVLKRKIYYTCGPWWTRRQ